MKICFKKIVYGDQKGDIIAVSIEETEEFAQDTFIRCFKLFEAEEGALRMPKEFLMRSCAIAKENEYLSTLSMLKRRGIEVEIVKSLRK